MPAIEIALCTTRPSLRILARVKISSAKEQFLPAIIFTGLASSSSWRYLPRNKYQHKNSNLKLIHDKITKTIVKLTLDIVLDYCYLCYLKRFFIMAPLHVCFCDNFCNEIVLHGHWKRTIGALNVRNCTEKLVMEMNF